MLKKTTLAILSLAASGFASAGMYSPAPAPTCVPGDVTVPCAANKWDIGVQALYLKPIYDAHKGYEYNNDGTASNFKDANGDWDWGYRLEGSYHFSTGNDITMTWLHFDNNSIEDGYTGATPFSLGFVPFSLYLNNKFDQVNLVMGQHVDMGVFKNARFYGGLQYAKVRVDTQNRYLTVPPAIAALATEFLTNRNTDFNGVGPVMGIDYAYDLSRGFSVTANTAGSILYGSSRFTSGCVFNPSGLTTCNVYASKKSIVPSLEAKLGLNYAYELAQGVLNIEGGYQALNYFDVLETSGIAGALVNSDFGLYGPYIGLKWVGNA